MAMTREASTTRRDVLKFLTSGAALLAMPKMSEAKRTTATSEDTVAAVKTLTTVQAELKTVDELLANKDYPGVLKLFEQPEFAKIEENLLKLVNGPILNADDKKTIGTRKRYGIAADVIYGVGGVKGAIANIDDPQIESCKNGICSGSFVDVNAEVPKSLNSLKASLSEVLQICKQYKEFVRSE